ncbi:MAG: cytochrome c oxidase assembly protein [Pseudomonadota bacterium]|nr:cytochrome c oxidase assembly protein [Pseudomonadota bacterium]
MTPDIQRRNRLVLLSLLALVGVMAGLAFASAPLYSLFCRITGFGGTTQQASTLPGRILDRTMTVRFNADVHPGLPWAFTPNDREVTVRLGQQGMTTYTARNRSVSPVTGVAVYNVTPDKAGVYFSKIDCFCFAEQSLAAGQTVDMPVLFFVDPAMADDPALKDVDTITLSYTFFQAKSSALEDRLKTDAEKE